MQGVTSARTPGGARVTLYGFKQPKRLSAAELPFSVAPVQWPRNDPRLLVDSAAPHTDSWFEGYAWRVVGASTPCGVVHLGWLYSDGSTEFLALIARPATDGEPSERRQPGDRCARGAARGVRRENLNLC